MEEDDVESEREESSEGRESDEADELSGSVDDVEGLVDDASVLDIVEADEVVAAGEDEDEEYIGLDACVVCAPLDDGPPLCAPNPNILCLCLMILSICVPRCAGC